MALCTKQPFSERVASLRAFHKTRGHWPSRTDNMKLSNFCRSVRRARKCPEKEAFVKLNEGRIAILDAMGFDWNPQRRNSPDDCHFAFGDVSLVGSDPPAEPVMPPGPADAPVTEYDVLVGRALGQLSHEGTRQFKDLLEKHRPTYVAAPKRVEKAAIARSAVLLVRRRGGRFLRKGRPGDAEAPLREIGDAAAEKWAKGRLRRGAAAGGREITGDVEEIQGRVSLDTRPLKRAKHEKRCQTAPLPPTGPEPEPPDRKTDARPPCEGNTEALRKKISSPS